VEAVSAVEEVVAADADLAAVEAAAQAATATTAAPTVANIPASETGGGASPSTPARCS
jgi:hypothetical protein